MVPLAERLRPLTIEDYIGQRHLVGEGAPLRLLLDQGHVPSLILWGPPGVGKTTLARILARTLSLPLHTLSAVHSGVKEVREVIEQAKKEAGLFTRGASPLLFIDEIHRFSKSQQDSLLQAVEQGVVTLIGATTENPSFEVIRPLLSRCQVYVLEPLSQEDLLQLLDRALTQDALLRDQHIEVQQTGALLRYSGGDGRKLLNILELCAQSGEVITDALVDRLLQQHPLAYDKDGDQHYDLISAFIKSIRGSDPDAALYYMARMIEGGEDPLFIARRLVISASEDIGLANPNALLLANACFDAVSKIGMPEGRIPLAEAAIYLATSPKSNSAYQAVGAALAYVKRTGDLPVPLHLRNAPTSLMASLGYADGYKYAHDYPGHFVPQQFLPDAAAQDPQARFWQPQPHTPQERQLLERMQQWWGERFK